MTTIFSRILAGELPAHFVWRDEQAASFLSINPIQRGHALVVPVQEVDHWLDAPPELNAHLVQVAQVIGRAQLAAFQPVRIGLIVAGFEVPHLHVHAIPTWDMSDFDFRKAAQHVDQEDLAAAAAAIRTELRTLGRAEVVEA